MTRMCNTRRLSATRILKCAATRFAEAFFVVAELRSVLRRWGFFCCTMSPYSGSFDVSIGLNEASCSGRKSSPGMSPRAEWAPGRCIVSALLVPANDLDR